MPNQYQIRQLQDPSGNTDIFPLTVEEAVYDENGILLSVKILSMQSSLAPVERTTTASAPHSIGDYIVCAGQFCKVTAAIAVGDTIADGVNVDFTNLSSEMGSGGSGGGHTIINSSDTAMTQRTKLKFVNANVADDSQNEETVITIPQIVNSLLSNDTDKSLSAAQGKALKALIDDLSAGIDEILTEGY